MLTLCVGESDALVEHDADSVADSEAVALPVPEIDALGVAAGDCEAAGEAEAKALADTVALTLCVGESDALVVREPDGVADGDTDAETVADAEGESVGTPSPRKTHALAEADQAKFASHSRAMPPALEMGAQLPPPPPPAAAAAAQAKPGAHSTPPMGAAAGAQAEATEADGRAKPTGHSSASCGSTLTPKESSCWRTRAPSGLWRRFWTKRGGGVERAKTVVRSRFASSPSFFISAYRPKSLRPLVTREDDRAFREGEPGRDPRASPFWGGSV